MDHFIVTDGAFDRTVKKMMAMRFAHGRSSLIRARCQREANGESRSGKRVRYVCPHGDMKAWAKHDAKLVCGSTWSRWSPTNQRHGAISP
jgi:hypothetical protein